MSHIDERSHVTEYLRETTKTIDGLGWLVTCLLTLLFLLDVYFGTNIIPLRDASKPEKAMTLLMFSPILIFLILVWLRQFPFGRNVIASLIRAVLCIFVFLIINF